MPPPGTPHDLYANRIARLRKHMRATGVDMLLLGPSSDLFYLTGFDAHLSERLNLLVIASEGTPSLIVPVLEVPLVGAARRHVSVHPWADGEDAYELTARVIGDVAGKHVAVGNQLWSAFLLRIQARVGAATWTEATPLMRELRMIKDAVEIDLMSEVSRLTDEAWEAFIAGPPISGLSEREALARLTDLTAERGITKIWGICASGPNSASPHHATGERLIAEGDAVIFDWGGSLEGYQSDVTRTVCVGAPWDEFRTVYDVVLRANQAALDAVHPGVPIEELDRTARTLIADAGYGEAFIHRVGHGLGLDIHEEPYLTAGNDLPLAPGMVFSDEPGIYLAGKFGVRIEDTVLCTPDGGVRLNHATRELTALS
ncbi:MAG: Aminopeptidase YpdF (MP-, MA-, MS-, AP-, NP-specific) [uncultured Thermomicrobiales bacterium]|uniref:Aminopeptidase YpdF (MP-, MA-, MS-, AP-, NP-specific) n=1 Tax=uncultured Thermomicrobiales bacterium TaxID=1645740 RepID=A0A6J4VNM7_9BACT|nr:MAG: Aminopeptidase YpdF (MP-, MA-, MS-, AP-, NP-specific) [uncultured Thermomicrobiales bacterium]